MGSADVSPASERLLAFAKDDGSVSRMAVVRAPTPLPMPLSSKKSSAITSVGRYVLGPQIASGGMASVHLGRLRGSAGFARTVAIKRLLPALAQDPEFVARFLEEARFASRVRHANVVPTLDVVDVPEVLLVLEYVHGESLARLLRISASRGVQCPPKVASAIVSGVLRGLHAAHEATAPNGAPLELVHRDVSPQNVLVGADGVPRMLDFGIAKAAGREESTINRAKATTRDLRGKLAYMAPEQVSGEPIDRRADLFAAGVMLWETLAGDRLFKGEDAVTTMEAIFHREPPRLSKGVAKVSARVDDVLATALAKDAAQRFATADEMARAIETALPPASDREVAEWIESIAAEVLTARSAILTRFEGSTEPNDDDAREDATTEKRSALLPPVLPNAVPPRMRDEAKTVPSFDASPMPDAHEPLRTPMAMVSPANDPLAASGMSATRVGGIDIEAIRSRQASLPPPIPMRTPIPMPMPPPKRSFGFAGVAALVLTPAAAAAIAIFASHAAPAQRAHAVANEEPPPAVIAEPPTPTPPLPARVPIAEPPPTTALVAKPPAPAASASAPRVRRGPWVRPPRKR